MQVTIKLGLRAVIDSVTHCLCFSTCTLLLSNDYVVCVVALCYRETTDVKGDETYCLIVESSTREPLTTEADFLSSRH